MNVDPVTLQVIQARLAGIVQEMQNSLFRTGYSTIIRESQDASCAILNRQGEVVAQHVDGLELDDEARALSEKRLGRKVMRSPLPDLEEVPDRHYDLVGAFDVIEHIDDDRAALASIATKLKPGGTFLMTVPAHQWMWTAHDTVNHHKRRYSKRNLKQLIETSPLKLDRLGYFNSLLFPLAVAERTASKLRGKDDADVKLPVAPLNAALETVFAAERYLVGRLPLPPGLSLFAVASAR